MSKAWPLVALGEVLTHRKEFIQINDLDTYKRCRVQLHAQGIVLRDSVVGAEIKTKKQQVCKAGEFLVAEIDAKVGGFGTVPEELNGAIVSSHYFLFGIDETHLDRRFLGYYVRTPAFRDQVTAQGSTNYAAIRPRDVLGYTIPLPPLAEQKRVVAWIEELAAKIEEARGLRRQAMEEAEALISSESVRIFESLERNHPVRQFGEYKPHITSGPRNWGKHYQEKGIRFYRAQDIGIDGKIATETKVFVVPPPGEQGRSAMLRPGDLLFVITGATVGRCAVYDDSLEPGLVSQHVSICRLPAESILPEYALWGMRSPCGQSQLLGQRYGQGKPGLNLTNIRALSLPIPPLPEQRRILAYLDSLHAKLNTLKNLQSETTAELDAMLPSILDKAFQGKLL